MYVTREKKIHVLAQRSSVCAVMSSAKPYNLFHKDCASEIEIPTLYIII